MTDKTITAEELEKVKEHAVGRGFDLNECTFWKSSKDNVLCRVNKRDYFALKPDGKFLELIQGVKIPKLISNDSTKIFAQNIEAALEAVRKELTEGQGEETNVTYSLTQSPTNIRRAKKKRYACDIIAQPIINKKIGTSYRSPFTITIYNDVSAEQIKTRILSEIKSRLGKTEIKFQMSQELKETIAREINDKFTDKVRKKFIIDSTLDCSTEYAFFYVFMRNGDGIDAGSPMFDKGACLEKNMVRFQFAGMSFSYSLDKKKLIMQKEDEALAVARLCRKQKLKLCNCQARISKEHGGKMRITPDGIRFEFIIDKKNVNKTITKEEDISVRSLNAWIKKKKEMEEEKKAKEKEKALNKLKNLRSFGNLTAKAIIQTVQVNERYITENAVIANLRGMKKQLNAEVKDTEYSGLFECVKKEDMEEIVGKLVMDGILMQRRRKGTYGTFYTLETTLQAKQFLEVEAEKPDKSIPFSEYKEEEWLAYMRNRPKRITQKAVSEQVCILECKGLFCLRREEMIEFLEDKPAEWLEYAKMMYSMETGIEKKYWKMVVETIETAAEKKKETKPEKEEEAS